MKKLNEIPVWLRIINISAGVLFLLLGIGVLLDFGLTQQILIVVLSFALVLISLVRTINGISNPTFSEKIQYLNIFIGAIGLSMASTVIIIPTMTSNTAIFLLGVGLSVQGVARIAVGGIDQTLVNWVRGLLVGVGIITIVISLIVIFLQTTDESILIALLAYALIANGAARIVKAVVKPQIDNTA